MQIPQGATVVVADGEKISLFKNTGTANAVKLEATPIETPDSENSGSGARHQNSAANPSESQASEDDFAAGVATMLNAKVQQDSIQALVVIAAPRTLGELRKHYSKQLSSVLVGEVSKDLTGHTSSDIEKVILAA